MRYADNFTDSKDPWIDIDESFFAIRVYTNRCQGKYRRTSNISRTLVGNKIVDNSYVVGAPPVGAAPTTSSWLSTWLQWIEQRQLHDEIRNI